MKLFNFGLSLLLTLIILLPLNLYSQNKGTREAEFFPQKVIFTDIDENGKSTKKEIEAPKEYTAIRGDILTDAFVLSKFDKKGEKKQTIPVIKIYQKALHHYDVTYFGKETIQLPDKVFADVDHFTVFVKETFDSTEIMDFWIDNRGCLVLCTMISMKDGPWKGAIVSYQESYDKNNKKGKICDLFNGQYIGFTEWQVEDYGNDLNKFKLTSVSTENMGGFSMTIEYSLDKKFNPKSYTEHWTKPSK